MIEFLKIYDITKRFKEISDEGKYYERYFIQEDTHVFHVFRIIKGNYDDDTNDSGFGDDPDSGYTIEREDIRKEDILDQLEIRFSTRQDRDSIFKGMTPTKLIKGIIDTDEYHGFSNWDFFVYETIDECIKYKITEDYWEIVNI